tara:strand:- start:406 stop:783 length:378 start_codon:yes stop_codon:yes gene_type:complete
MTDGGMLSALGWFFLGVFSYRIMSGILSIGQASLLIQKIVSNSLRLLKAAEGQACAVNEVKYGTLRESGATEDQVSFVRETDDRLLETWRQNSVLTIVNCLSERSRKLVKVETWQDAQRYLEKKI